MLLPFNPALLSSTPTLPTDAHRSIVIVSTACDLDDASFSRVAPVARTALPRAISACTSCGDRTTHSLSPSTKTPRRASSRMARFVRSGRSRSEMVSL